MSGAPTRAGEAAREGQLIQLGTVRDFTRGKALQSVS